MTEHQQQMLEACKRGDRAAQKMLYEHFKGKLFVVCLRYADTRTDAEDLLQDGFIRIFKDLHQFRGEGSLEGWMRRVVVNVALQQIRQRKKALEFTELDGQEYKLGEEGPVFGDGEETAKGLLKLLQKMPLGFRTVLNLYVLENYSHQQIADELGISVGTSKSQLNRAKAHLKSMLERNLAG